MKNWKQYAKVGLPAFAAGALCTASFFGGAVLRFTDDPAAFVSFLNDFREIKENYFRPISDKDLLTGASMGMFASVGDPYTVVLSGEKYDSFMEGATGEYGGIGVVIGISGENKPVIINVFSTGTAGAAGLMAGDVLLAVDGKTTDELGLNGTASAVRGEKGTTVEIDVERNGETLHFTVERSEITMPTVQSFMADEGIGYIHIYTFGKHTADEFRDQLASLKIMGAKKLIIDVRMNPGGLIDSVVGVANQILTKGTVVSYHTKDGKAESYDIDGVEEPMPLAILIDRNSASASEILAGAVQDKKEGIILGENSFGKGTVQAIFDTGDKKALKISIAEYRTPSGKTIDKVGIAPDETVEQTGFVFDKETDSVYKRAIEKLRE